MEIVGETIDRLVTSEIRCSGREDRGNVVPLYESARRKLGVRSLSLLAANRIIKEVNAGDNVILITGVGVMPFLPHGETDGPPGVASIARAVRLGLGALPIFVLGDRDTDSVRYTVKAAGLNVEEYNEARATYTATSTIVSFPYTNKEESEKIAVAILDEYVPRAVISVETIGPNKKGIKHTSSGVDLERSQKLPGLEYIFSEANARGILTIGCLDNGNELGSGTIEEDVRRIAPSADVCQCPCRGGAACVIKSEIPFPAATSNWGAYGIAAMVAFLLKKPEVLQDASTERRMMEACVMTGGVDSQTAIATPTVDGISGDTDACLITILHAVIEIGLSTAKHPIKP